MGDRWNVEKGERKRKKWGRWSVKTMVDGEFTLFLHGTSSLGVSVMVGHPDKAGINHQLQFDSFLVYYPFLAYHQPILSFLQ